MECVNLKLLKGDKMNIIETKKYLDLIKENQQLKEMLNRLSSRLNMEMFIIKTNYPNNTYNRGSLEMLDYIGSILEDYKREIK